MSGGATQTVILQQPGGGVTNNRIASVNSDVIAEYGNAPVGAGGTRFYHPDRLSNRMVTDTGGAVKGVMDNLPFGEDALTGTGESEKHRFTNYERDSETGTDYAINRQHSFSTGRFSRPDVVAGNIANPQSMNRYAYAINDPVNLTDPLGLLAAYGGTCYLIISGTHWYQGDDYIGTTISSVTLICFGGGGGGGAFDDSGGGGGYGNQELPKGNWRHHETAHRSINCSAEGGG